MRNIPVNIPIYHERSVQLDNQFRPIASGTLKSCQFWIIRSTLLQGMVPFLNMSDASFEF